MKTQQYQSYQQQSVPLDESEQQTILEVIQRAEELESMEQERVGLESAIPHFHKRLFLKYIIFFKNINRPFL